MSDTPTIDNKVLTTLRDLSDDELTAFATVNLEPLGGGVLTFWVEVGRLANIERLARRGGPRPVDSNALWMAANQLAPSEFDALVLGLGQQSETLEDGPVREFVQALGFMLAVQARGDVRLRTARMN